MQNKRYSGKPRKQKVICAAGGERVKDMLRPWKGMGPMIERESKMQALSCPCCAGSVMTELGDAMHNPCVAETGQLIHCDHCRSMLEYTSNGSSLALRPASQRRIDEFNCVTRDGYEPSLAEIMDYVIEHRGIRRNQSRP